MIVGRRLYLVVGVEVVAGKILAIKHLHRKKI